VRPHWKRFALEVQRKENMGNWKQGDSLEAVDNPTAMEIAFFAGFYDGEGNCFVASKCRALGLKVCQKDPELLYKMRDLWGGSVKFWATRSGKASPTFEGYDSWKNPIYKWSLSGDRARKFLKQIYPFLSSRRKAQVDKLDLTLNGRMKRESPILSPERAARRAEMNAHEKYLESKSFFRANNIDRLRAENREAKRHIRVAKKLNPAIDMIQ
jgi:hypothetical protein